MLIDVCQTQLNIDVAFKRSNAQRGFIGLAIAGIDEDYLQVQLEKVTASDGKSDGSDGTVTAKVTGKTVISRQSDGSDGKNEVSDILFDKTHNTHNIYINNEVSGSNASHPSLSIENNDLCRHTPVTHPSLHPSLAVTDFDGSVSDLPQPIDNAELDELLQKIPTDDRFAVRQEFEKRHKLDNEGAWAWLVDFVTKKAEK